MGQFVADSADDGAGDAAHDVRTIAALADLLENGGLLFSGDTGFKDNNHSCVAGSRAAENKKAAGETCGGVVVAAVSAVASTSPPRWQSNTNRPSCWQIADCEKSREEDGRKEGGVKREMKLKL